MYMLLTVVTLDILLPGTMVGMVSPAAPGPPTTLTLPPNMGFITTLGLPPNIGLEMTLGRPPPNMGLTTTLCRGLGVRLARSGPGFSMIGGGAPLEAGVHLELVLEMTLCLLTMVL